MLDGLVSDNARFVAATPQLLDAELTSFGDLEFSLGAPVSRDWPPEGWDRTTIAWMRHRLLEHPDEAGWWAAYLVSHDGVVVGTIGLKGPPADGDVEVGYGLVPSAFGFGYATLAVGAVIDAAWERTDVQRVIAHARAGDHPSIAVLRRTGFEAVRGSAGAEVRYVRHVG